MSQIYSSLRLAIAVNLLPLAGLILLEWTAAELLFVYWIEITLLVMFYSTLVLFAPQKPTPNEGVTPTIPVPFISSRTGSKRISNRLPLIYYRNVKYATGSLVLGLAFWWLSGTVLLDLLAPEPTIQGGRFERPLSDFIGVVTNGATLEGVVAGIGLCSIHVILAQNDINSENTFEDVSAPTLARIPFCVGLYWFVVMILTQFLLILTWPLSGGSNPALYTELRVIIVFLGAKFVLERSLVYFRLGSNPGRLVRWLTLGYARGLD